MRGERANAPPIIPSTRDLRSTLTEGEPRLRGRRRNRLGRREVVGSACRLPSPQTPLPKGEEFMTTHFKLAHYQRAIGVLARLPDTQNAGKILWRCVDEKRGHGDSIGSDAVSP